MAEAHADDERARFFTLCQDMLCIAGTEGYFRRLNPAWTRVLGWSEEELLASPYVDFVHPDDRDSVMREAAAIAAGHNTVSFDNRVRCRDGTYRWLQWTWTLVGDDQQVYATARDVTAVKATQAALRHAHDQAARATQAKNEFLSRMSHDLRTPLNAIMGFAQLLQLNAVTSEQADSAAHILRGGRHLLQLINEVLDLSRIEAGRLSLSLEPVALKDVVPHAVALIGPLAEQRRIVISTADLGELTVFADRQRLTQILLNLLANSVKYNRQGGRVTVSGHLTGAGMVSLEIEDTGVGIPAHHLARLFTPFERLGAEHSEVEGTGLGLALSRGLAEAMRGSLVAESVVDCGSTLILELPSCTAILPRARKTQDDTPAVSGVTGTVVYVEDNLPNLRLMERLLANRPGVELLHAPDGLTGLTLVRARRPNLVLLDLHLPGIVGEEVLRQIWDDPETRAIPVAVLSADATQAQQRRLLAAGAIAYLTKPFDIGEVLRLVDRTLSRAARIAADVHTAAGGTP